MSHGLPDRFVVSKGSLIRLPKQYCAARNVQINRNQSNTSAPDASNEF